MRVTPDSVSFVSFCVVFSPFFLHFELDKTTLKEENKKKKKKEKSGRVKEREIPGGGTFIIFNLSPANQKRAIQFERQLCAQQKQQQYALRRRRDEE